MLVKQYAELHQVMSAIEFDLEGIEHRLQRFLHRLLGMEVHNRNVGFRLFLEDVESRDVAICQAQRPHASSMCGCIKLLSLLARRV